jgi:hypothetical protein
MPQPVATVLALSKELRWAVIWLNSHIPTEQTRKYSKRTALPTKFCPTPSGRLGSKSFLLGKVERQDLSHDLVTISFIDRNH